MSNLKDDAEKLSEKAAAALRQSEQSLETDVSQVVAKPVSWIEAHPKTTILAALALVAVIIAVCAKALGL